MDCGNSKMSFSHKATSSMDIAEKRPVYSEGPLGYVDLSIDVP